MGLSVRGKGLRVTGVGAHMDGHGTGVRARLITCTPEGYRSELTGWKDANPVSAALIKVSMISWKWAGKGRAFEHGTKLCVPSGRGSARSGNGVTGAAIRPGCVVL
ncbi:hypothetical protein ACIRUY_17850 [Streptomyces erythrochromogenes]|uniref:hypothetical protein n=1 Tax=Streptomyces erythrochromogenes TaxID=285574 RepID=UPI00381F1C28